MVKVLLLVILILINYLGFGFKKFYSIKDKKNLKKDIKKFLSSDKLSFLEAKITNSKIKKLPRPTDLIKIKNQFMR